MSIVAVRSVTGQQVAADLSEHEYRRLLQWPRARNLPDALRERSRDARQWYARLGKPFLATRRVDLRDIDAASVTLETGAVLTGERLAADLRSVEAHALAVVAASAGTEVAVEAARRWEAGCPDDAYFLDRLAAGVAERLLACAASDLCRELAPHREHLLPHRSPGCDGWDLADQQRLMQVLGERCGPVALLESGALRPQHSVLAVFGITRRAGAAANPASACRRCVLEPCDFRRVAAQSRECRQ